MKLQFLAFITAFTLSACSKAGDLPSGIYLQSKFDGASLRNTLYVFKDGQVAYQPSGDLENLDFDKLKAANPKNVGTYSKSGDTLTIQWGGDITHTGTLKPDSDNGFQFRSDAYAPVKPLPGGTQLKGEYYGGASVAGAYASVTYTFDGNGGYKTDAAGVAVTTTAASAVTAGSSSSDSGTYQISGSRIKLTGNAGAREISLFYVPMKDETEPSMLLLGGVVLTKK